MPIPGQGVVPPAGGIYNELAALTRRAFIPRVVVQIYYSTPTLMMLLKNAQRSAGGMAQITGPVQGNSMVQGSWAGYSGAFNQPQIIPAIQNAQWNTAYNITPVPLVMGESFLQSTEAVVPILDARMNDVKAYLAQQMSSALYTNNSANVLMPNGFVEATDNGTNVPIYGGINRTAQGNSFWAGQYYSVGTNILNRKAMAQYLIQITDAAGGECPDFVIMSPSDYAALNSDFIGVENIYVTPGSNYSFDTTNRSSFPNLLISGVPFYGDHWCPKGTMYFINTKYTGMYLSEDAPFEFSGFYSTIPMLQVAQIGVCIVGYQVVSFKPSANAVITGFSGGAF